MTQGTSFWQFVLHQIRGLSVLVAVITLVLMTAPVARAQTYTVLHSFCSQPNCTDGGGPREGVIQATDGNLYGTTGGGGANGYGTVFKMTPSGTLTTLYSFSEGSYPGSLIQATDGDLYGVTGEGGSSNVGTVFKMTPSGTLTTLYSFCSQPNCTDGSSYPGTLLQATNGNLYGTTGEGGANNVGIVFMLNVGLGPFVALQTTSGGVGVTVKILGTGLTGATSVTFNGTPATFTVNSTGAAITATVPTGATTGTVRVVTPNGTLNSNVVYTVK
jgi:uncharacterized repeat protein (TIGR03803 family)